MPTETSAVAKPSALNPEQEMRAAALRVAREVLVQKLGLASSGKPDPIDLVSIASWVIDGRDPYQLAEDVAEKLSDRYRISPIEVPPTATINYADNQEGTDA